MVLGQAFRSERSFGGGLKTEASAPVGEAGRSRKRAPFLLGQAFRSVIGSLFWPVVHVLGPAHESHVCSQRLSARPNLCRETGP